MEEKNSQRSVLNLLAQENVLTKDVDNDYYLSIRRQDTLDIKTLAKEVAKSHGGKTASEVEMLTNEVLELAAWYLSNGFSVNTPLGYFQTNVQGIVTDAELDSIDMSRIKLSVGYTMSQGMTTMLGNAKINVEVDKAKVGPQISAVISSQDAKNPEAVTRGESVPVKAGATTIIRGRNLKVGGPADSGVGITLTRVDQEAEPIFIPAADLYPNEPKEVGFIMPASAPDGSTWSVTLKTQIGSRRGVFLKEPREFTLQSAFTVGQASSPTTPGSGDDDDSGQGTFG